MSDPTDQSNVVTLTADAIQAGHTAGEQELLSTIALRERVAKYLLILFIGTNVAVLVTIGGLAWIDYRIGTEIVQRATTQPAAFEKLLGSPGGVERLRSVNSNVLIALIGATTVQVGAGVIAMTQYLFPRKGQPLT